MYKKILISILLCCLTIQTLSADYSLPPVEEQLILLLDLKQIKLSDKQLSFTQYGVPYHFPVKVSWMQDRIYSDGLCVIDSPYPKSALLRIRNVQHAIKKQQEIKVLIELVSTVGANGYYMVTYLKFFKPEKEFARYFPEQDYYDTLQLPMSIKPNDSEEFVKELERMTSTSKQKIKNNSAWGSTSF